MSRYEVIPHLLRVVTDKGMFGCWYIKFILGPGASKCWKVKGREISGYTFYVAWKCSRAGMKVPKLTIGFTGDANTIPYTTH